MASASFNGDAGKAGLDAVDAEGVEMAGDFEFLLPGRAQRLRFVRPSRRVVS